MAQGTANLAKYPGGRDVWGGHGIFFAKYTGPVSYNNSGTPATSGDFIDSVGALTEIGAANTPLRTIDAIPPVVSVSGTYLVVFAPVASGAGGTPSKRWYARWFTMITMAEVVNAVDLHTESAVIMVIGG